MLISLNLVINTLQGSAYPVADWKTIVEEEVIEHDFIFICLPSEQEETIFSSELSLEEHKLYQQKPPTHVKWSGALKV